jgi:hypothetical protein
VALRAISIAFCFVSEWGFEAADRHDRLARAVFLAVATLPALHGSRKIAGVPVYPLRLGRRLVSPEQRVGRPRHSVVYRVGMDGVVADGGNPFTRLRCECRLSPCQKSKLTTIAASMIWLWHRATLRSLTDDGGPQGLKRELPEGGCPRNCKR